MEVLSGGLNFNESGAFSLGVRIVVISIDLNHWNLFHRFEDT